MKLVLWVMDTYVQVHFTMTYLILDLNLEMPQALCRTAACSA